MQLGVCYYPEHWPADRWPLDAQLMAEAGIGIVRIGEFAWEKMEPAEGRFTGLAVGREVAVPPRDVRVLRRTQR